MSIEAMKRWLAALEMHVPHVYKDRGYEPITSLRQAIEQAQKQEPVAWCEQSELDWLNNDKRGASAYVKTMLSKRKDGLAMTPLYTFPPQRQWVGLTDEDIDQGLLRSDYAFKTAEAWRAGVVFAMTKLKEKNT